MKRILVAALIAPLALVACSAPSAAPSPSPTIVPAQANDMTSMPPEESKDSLLFSVISEQSTVGKDGDTLTVSVPADSALVWFTDRPDRRAGQGTLEGLISQWQTFGFDEVPPNAVIVTSKDGEFMQYPVTLDEPRIEGDQATFAAVRLANDDFPVAGMVGEKGPELTSGTFGATQLFIDTASTQRCFGLRYSWSADQSTVYLTTYFGRQAWSKRDVQALNEGLGVYGLAWQDDMVVCVGY